MKKRSKTPEFSLGEKIKFLRESRKLTQADLAKASSLTQSAIANLENEAKGPSIETLEKIAKALDVHIATLFTADDVYVFDLKRLRRKYTKHDQLTPHLYMALGQVLRYAKDIGFNK